jgi:Protein of unknown function (DUF402)
VIEKTARTTDVRRDGQEHRIGGSNERRHAAGDAVVARTVTNGKIRWAAAAIVVSDTDETTIYYRPPGTKNKVTRGARTSGRYERELALRSELLRGDWDLVDHQTSGTATLVVNRSGDWFSVWLTPESHTGDFVPTYVNIETPQVRTPLGFDVDDLCLDLVIGPNLEWQMKDAGDLEARAVAGVYTLDEVRVIRAAAATAIVRIETRQPPFDGSLASWRPDVAWQVPVLPKNWAEHTV